MTISICPGSFQYLGNKENGMFVLFLIWLTAYMMQNKKNWFCVKGVVSVQYKDNLSFNLQTEELELLQSHYYTKN